uniref:Uncharacterized protein n=1 Tax=Arundo donax TaxID=35708 RepID=A0A0A8Y5M6_ARUDO
MSSAKSFELLQLLNVLSLVPCLQDLADCIVFLFMPSVY